MASTGLILSVDKPAGWTSFDVVAKLRNILRWKKVGHAGTLDPMATGVLLILCGSATRRSGEFMDLHKEYRAVIRFGVATTTDDMTGDVTEEIEIANWSEERIRTALGNYIGEIQQSPPAVSAIKVSGRRSYKAAFAGEPIEHLPRPVTVYGIELTRVARPEIEVVVRCGRGTYIRSIARDLGRELHWGGALSSLERTAIGPCRVERSFTLESIVRHKSEFSWSA